MWPNQTKHKDTIKVVHAPPIINLLPLDESLDSSLDQQSADCDPPSYAESSAGTSSQDTIILSKQWNTTERCQPWPKQFTNPQSAYETETYLERAAEDYRQNGTLVTTSKVKADIHEKLSETIYTYTAYPSSAQISDVAEALVRKYPLS